MRLPDIGWCEVGAGEFVMGSDEGEKREQPQHTVTIPYDYQIAKYPVTNIQYSLFVEAGGYSEAGRRFWTEAGWGWKKDIIAPRLWKNRLYNLANQPVVAVTWYEAVAFCHWLTEKLREIGELDESQVIRLPTEAEWEKAARGTDGRKYPWGNDEPTPEHANYEDTDIGSPCAVGLFPRSASPYEVEGMAGNVWEWCATKVGGKWPSIEFKPYPYNIEDEWSDKYLAGDSQRALRGGAFGDNADFLRAASRLNLNPYDSSRILGFRLISSPF
ncbi:formylglycine-generating enzyme family protein [Anaerolineales bacterium HSG25]|nr:formylglycine-generating enzyme family protein [Anaerolineales bacterium HSG25]